MLPVLVFENNQLPPLLVDAATVNTVSVAEPGVRLIICGGGTVPPGVKPNVSAVGLATKLPTVAVTLTRTVIVTGVTPGPPET